MATTSTDTPRRRNARGEGDRLRVDLLESAANLMAVHGNVAEVSLRKVAKQAGVSPTAVYRHFDDHTELLRESVQFCWNNFYEALRDARATSDDPFERLQAAGRAYVAFAFDAPGQYRVLFASSIDVGLTDSDPEAAPAMAAFQVLIDLVADILRTKGDDRDPFFVAVQVHTWIHGMVHLCSNNQQTPWPETDDLLAGLTEALRLGPTDESSA